jgi:hypothetical protein
MMVDAIIQMQFQEEIEFSCVSLPSLTWLIHQHWRNDRIAERVSREHRDRGLMDQKILTSLFEGKRPKRGAVHSSVL